MPGSSLWLLPPPSHPLQSLLTSLITHVSKHYNSPHLFIPHVTLTSEISPSIYSSDPQAWLDALKFPAAKDVEVRFKRLQVGTMFFGKLTISVGKGGVWGIGSVAREVVDGEESVKEWLEENFGPHLSLLYSEIELSHQNLEEMEKVVREAGVNLEGEGEAGGWVGGRVVLVPTDKKIEEWQPIALKDL